MQRDEIGEGGDKKERTDHNLNLIIRVLSSSDRN